MDVYQLFEQHRRYVVPLYQRPYVWTLADQWRPFWEDVKDRAEEVLLAKTDGRSSARRTHPHFLGAIVTRQVPVSGRQVHRYEVIDGQQRLTTLQVFLAAFRDVVAESEDAQLHQELSRVTWNEGMVAHEDERFKVWPTNVDRHAFRRVIAANGRDGVEVFANEAREEFRRVPTFVKAYDFFDRAIRHWTNGGDPDDDVPGNGPAERIEALYEALRHHVQVVEIALDEGDDPQVIFETLNARGAPLLPSDLIRNYLFTRAEANGESPDDLYDRLWKRFDDVGTAAYWTEEVPFGRVRRPRMLLFLFHFLTAQLIDDVKMAHLYASFKAWFEAPGGPESVEEGLEILVRYAEAYRRIATPEASSRFGRFADRLDVLDLTAPIPLLLHVMVEKDVPGDDLDRIAADIESFLVRRLVCKLTTKNYNRLFLLLLKNVRDRDGAPADIVRTSLAEGRGDSVRWPGDDEFLAAWLQQPAYRAFSRRRVAMILEAIEARLTTAYQEDIVFRASPTVEHVLPRAWRETWPPPAPVTHGPETPEVRRDRMLETFGNLTLITQNLNSRVSNGPFERKRDELVQTSKLRLNNAFHNLEHWDEETIEARGRALFEVARSIWTVPPRAASRSAAPSPTSTATTESGVDSEALGADEKPDAEALLPIVIETFEALNVPGTAVKKGRAKRFRIVRVDGWPDAVHYEFLVRGPATFGVDFHCELPKSEPARTAVIAAMDRLLPRVAAAFPGFDVERRDSPVWRWLCVDLDISELEAKHVAEGMKRLVETTRDEVDAALGLHQ